MELQPDRAELGCRIARTLTDLRAAEKLLVQPGAQKTAELTKRLEAALCGVEWVSGLVSRSGMSSARGVEGEIERGIREMRASAGRLAALVGNLEAFVAGYQARFCSAAGYTADGQLPVNLLQGTRVSVDETG